jgi:uncharacterized protein (TIGR00255 family)
MIRSMTGFGEAEESTEIGLVRIEVKTVNHRFFNLTLRVPPGFDGLQSEIQLWLRDFISRGHVTYTLTLDCGSISKDNILPQLDMDKAICYRDILDNLSDELNLKGDINLSHLIRFADIFRASDTSSVPIDIDVSVIKRLTQEAILAMIGMRDAEGVRLQEDLENRLESIGNHLGFIENRAPERLVEKRNHLKDAVVGLMENHPIDEDRLAREIAYMAEKWDFNEEIVRLRSHVELFIDNLVNDNSEPVGKRLGFMVQEMNREVNTIGAKANDLEISQSVIAIKEEVERIREQLDNVE